MPLDTYELAKSSSFPSSPNSLPNFSQLALRSLSGAIELIDAQFYGSFYLCKLQTQYIPPEKLCSILSGEVPMLTKQTHHDEFFCFYESQ